MNVLVLVEDLFSAAGPAGAFFRLAIPAAPEIRFLWPSRGADLRARARSWLPSNGAPFAIDRSTELRDIADGFCQDPAELAPAHLAAAAAVALQGMVLDAVDVPSLVPAAHLVRPIFDAVGVGVGRVVTGWLGDPRDLRRHDWPEPNASDDDGLAAVEARAAAAAELRYAVVASAPYQGDGPAVTLPLKALFALRPPAAAHARGGARPALCFTGHPDGAGGIDRFIRLAAYLPHGALGRCALPAEGLRSARRRLIAAEAARCGVDLRFDPGACDGSACGAAPAPAPVFDPAPLLALLRGHPVALSEGGWTAAALRAERASGLAPARLDLCRPDAELARTLSDLLSHADSAAAELRADLAVQRWRPADITLRTVYGPTPARARPRASRPAIAAPLAAAAIRPAQPRREAGGAPDVTAVVLVSAQPAGALAASLASMARQNVPGLEVIVVDDCSDDPVGMRDAVDAAGGFARLVRQRTGLAAEAMNRGLAEAAAPFVAFLPAGTLLTRTALADAVARLRLSDAAADAAWPPPGILLRRAEAMLAGGFRAGPGEQTVPDPAELAA